MIKIRVTDNIDCEISFDYSPTIIEKIKAIPMRTYNGITKNWTIPYSCLDLFLDSIKGIPYDIQYSDAIEFNEEKAKTFEFKTKPFQHQLEALQYGIEYDKFLIGDEQGLGKSKEAIDIAVYKKLCYNYKHCLIICGVKTLIFNWEREIATHSNERVKLLGYKKNKKGNTKCGTVEARIKDLDSLEDSYFVVTNVETLRNKKFTSKLIEKIKNREVNMIIFDEFHKVKNPDSQQAKALLSLKPYTRIALTGTPLMNSPLDAYTVLNWTGVEKHNYYQFIKHFCILGDNGFSSNVVVGYKNMPELNGLLNSVMLRRKKEDVLDLPPKVYTTEYLEMDKEQQLIYDSVREELIENIDKIYLSSNPLAQLIRLRQATGFTGILSTETRVSVKYDRVYDILEELSANGEKAVVFSNWKEVILPLYDSLKKDGFNPALITGDVEDRITECDKLNNDSSCKVLLGTIGSVGVGLTLTTAQTVIFLDDPWNRATKEQAEDRCHRIGTKGTVNIITLVCKDTIDEKIEEVIYLKGKISDALVDNEIKTMNKKSSVGFLLGLDEKE